MKKLMLIMVGGTLLFCSACILDGKFLEYQDEGKHFIYDTYNKNTYEVVEVNATVEETVEE